MLRKLFLLAVLTVALLIAGAPASLVDGAVARLTDGALRLQQAEGSLWHGRGILASRDAGGRSLTPWLPLAWDFDTAALARLAVGWTFRSNGSPLGGNGHNVTFDGRLFVLTTGMGWEARLLRPERVTMPDGSYKEAIVVYSLGNFISNQQQPYTDGGILFQVDLLKQKGSPRVVVGSNGVIPVWRYVHKPAGAKTTFYALPVSRLERHPDLLPTMADSARTKMKQSTDALRKRLNYPEIR